MNVDIHRWAFPIIGSIKKGSNQDDNDDHTWPTSK